MTQDANCDYNQLVELFSTDPGISASILRLANSPAFGITREVGSLKQAINVKTGKLAWRQRGLVVQTLYLRDSRKIMTLDLGAKAKRG